MDIRYLAGFFDGEGSVGVYKNSDKKGYCLRFQLTQNVTPQSKLIVDYLVSTYGVSVNVQNTLSGKKKYNIALSGAKAVPLLTDLLPHLILKKEQVEIALNWQKSKPQRKLNSKGHTIPFENEYFENAKRVSNLLKTLKV